MQSFSDFNLLKEKLHGSKKKGVWRLIPEPTYLYIDIKVPLIDYLRGDVLISDIKALNSESQHVCLDKLISLLYLQFLNQIRKGFSLEKLGINLVNKIDEFREKNLKTINGEKLKQLTTNTWIFETEETTDYFSQTEKKYAYLTIRIKRTEIYRGEVLLYDLSNVIEGIDFTVEDVIAMLYMDFIKKLTKEGNDEKVIRTIISSIESHGGF
ncbi:hypothetical protein V1503_24400 [Bacillus sp. SCS-151]|uniref:hypothetical protein n=1 Tax=Nanhaiella sioensis TaxID=3115293 RepID=UPI00397CB275